MYMLLDNVLNKTYSENVKIKSLVDIENTGIRDYREITVTSKRQITIPKLYFDHLQIHDTIRSISGW